MPFILSFITPSPVVAVFVLDGGADRVVVDLETTGKTDRQGLASAIHCHTMADVTAVSAFAPGKTFVRVDSNPASAPEQAYEAVKAGAAGIILPMFRSVSEVAAVKGAIGASARLVALAETTDALTCVGELAKSGAADEIHFGLRDLSIELGLPFMFQAMVHPSLLAAAARLRSLGFPFMTGGIAPPGKGLVDPLVVAGAQAALGSRGAFMSRDFGSGSREGEGVPPAPDFAAAVNLVRKRYSMARLECMDDPSAPARFIAALKAALKGAGFEE